MVGTKLLGNSGKEMVVGGKWLMDSDWRIGVRGSGWGILVCESGKCKVVGG